MQQRTSNDYYGFKDISLESSELRGLRVDVYTSEYCSFCEDALEIARSAAGRISNLGGLVEVVETSVDDHPALIEALNLVALPLIQVGQMQVVGLPRQEDIERLIHESILMDY